jgi:hypothetical protein
MHKRTALLACLGAALTLTACGGGNPEGVRPTGKVHYEKPSWMSEGELREAVNECRSEMKAVESSRRQAALTYYYCLKEQELANVHFVR